MKRLIIKVLLIVSALAIFTSCNKKNANPLIGEWEMTSLELNAEMSIIPGLPAVNVKGTDIDKFTFTFNEDKTYTTSGTFNVGVESLMEIPGHPIFGNGTWEEEEDKLTLFRDSLKLEMNVVEISKNYLELEITPEFVFAEFDFDVEVSENSKGTIKLKR